MAATLLAAGALDVILTVSATHLQKLTPVAQFVVETWIISTTLVAIGWPLAAWASAPSMTLRIRLQAAITGTLVGLGWFGFSLILCWTAETVALHSIAGTSPSSFAIGVAAIAANAAAEELFMRGGLQALLARSMGDLHSISLTALAFAAMHVVGGDRSWLEVANIALAGIVFGLLMAGTKSLLAPVCAHMTWNLMEACIGLYQNPGLAPFGALFDVDLQGPPLWGGSASGLGGSVALTMATVAVLAGLYPGRQASSMRRV